MTLLNDPNLDSVRRYVNLPKTRHLNPNGQRLFSLNKQVDPNQKFASPQLKTTRNKLLDIIQNQAQIFQNPDYNFVFPPTIFPDYVEGQIKNRVVVSRNDDYEQEDTFGHKLNQQQIQDIREKGQFKVASKINNGKVPHVWKINDWIVRGRVNIVEVWQNGLATCCQLVVSAAILFSIQIPENIIRILGLPIKLFDLIFGKRAITKFYTPDFHKEIAIDFWSDVMQNQLRNVNKQIGNNFLQLLYMKYEDHLNNDILVSNKLDLYRKKQQQISNFKTRLMNMEKSFNNDWQLQKKEIVDKITVQNIGNEQKVLNEVEQQKILQKVEEQKINRYLVYIRKNLPRQNMSQNAIEALVHLILIVTFIDGQLKQKTKRLTKMQNQIRSNIREQYPIRSRIGFCEGKLFKKQYESAKQRYEDQFYEQLGKNSYFRTLLNETYFSIYQKYLRTRKFYNTFLQQKKSKLKCLYGPVRVFRSTYPLLPSYQVIISKGYNNQNVYSLKKYVEMHSDTSTHFWKFKLYCMRLKSWTINWIVSLIGLAWAGPFGLRCLCGIEDFSYDEDINSTTGIKSQIKRETVLGKFRNVLQSIERSRQDFEAQPDLGLLGKSVSRICNYIQCYFLRLMLIGVLGVLVIYPFAIIISSLICFVLVLTFWFWIPVAMLICYLFNILIFEFQISYQFQGCLIKSIPLLSIILQFLLCIVRIVFAFLLLFVFAPLLAILYFLFLILQRIFRTILDCIMVCIIAKCGRTPSTDTRIARRISGPGMAITHYSSISEQNVYILVNAELEKLLVNKFVSLTRQQIQETSMKHRRSIQYLLVPFGSASSYRINPKIDQTKQKLKQRLNKMNSDFMRRYPQKPYNVRFSQQELKKYLDNSIKIVQNYVQSNRIAGWIFNDQNIKQGDYQQLTRTFWRNIFGSGNLIFQPLEDIDARLHIQENVTSNSIKLRNNMKSVMRTLQGGQIEPLKSDKNIRIQQSKISLYNQIMPVEAIHKICQLHSSNSGYNVNFNMEQPSFLLVAARNLEQAKISDKKILQNQVKQKQRNHETIIELFQTQT